MTAPRPIPARDRFITATAVAELTSLGRRTVYAQAGVDGFPRPVRLTPRRVAWRESEVLAWLESRPRSAA